MGLLTRVLAYRTWYNISSSEVRKTQNILGTFHGLFKGFLETSLILTFFFIQSLFSDSGYLLALYIAVLHFCLSYFVIFHGTH